MATAMRLLSGGAAGNGGRILDKITRVNNCPAPNQALLAGLASVGASGPGVLSSGKGRCSAVVAAVGESFRSILPAGIAHPSAGNARALVTKTSKGGIPTPSMAITNSGSCINARTLVTKTSNGGIPTPSMAITDSGSCTNSKFCLYPTYPTGPGTRNISTYMASAGSSVGVLGVAKPSTATLSTVRNMSTSMIAAGYDNRWGRLVPPGYNGRPPGGPGKMMTLFLTIGGMFGILVVRNRYEQQSTGSEEIPDWDITDEDGLKVNLDWSAAGFTPAVVPHYYMVMCGSCWAIVAVQNAQSLNAIVNNIYTDLSIQQVIDCVTKKPVHPIPAYGCAGGFPHVAFEYMKEVGLTTAAAYPVNQFQTCCRLGDKPIVFRLDDWEFVPNNEKAIKEALRYGPISVSVYSNDFFDRFIGRSIIEYEDCKPDPTGGGGNHSVLLVGYGKDSKGNKFWKVQNVWGDWWGDRGFAKLRRGVPDPRGTAGMMEKWGVRPILYCS